MTHRISIHDFHADPSDTIALANEHGAVEIYDDEGDCVLTISPGLLAPDAVVDAALVAPAGVAQWEALIELSGGADACRAAIAKMDDGRFTTDEVFAEIGDVRGRSFSCDGCHQLWQGDVTANGFPRGRCPHCGSGFVYASRPLRTAEDKT